jgi:hypothetical protein
VGETISGCVNSEGTIFKLELIGRIPRGVSPFAYRCIESQTVQLRGLDEAGPSPGLTQELRGLSMRNKMAVSLALIFAAGFSSTAGAQEYERLQVRDWEQVELVIENMKPHSDKVGMSVADITKRTAAVLKRHKLNGYIDTDLTEGNGAYLYVNINHMVEPDACSVRVEFRRWAEWDTPAGRGTGMVGSYDAGTLLVGHDAEECLKSSDELVDQFAQQYIEANQKGADHPAEEAETAEKE